MPGTKIPEAVRRERIIAAAFAIAAEQGLSAVTIRSVAECADTSAGLVIFYFETKDELVLALLDWVLATTTALAVGPDILAIADPLDRLVGLLRQEMRRLSSEPQRIRVFFEFWSAGIWSRPIRARMQAELDRYRHAFRPMAAAVISANRERFRGVTVDALCALAVSFIKGCAVQSMIEPTLDVAEFLRATEALLGRPRPARRPSARPRSVSR